MSEEEFERYLDTVSSRLGFAIGRKNEIREELRAHLDDRWDELEGSGLPRDRRVERVLEEFGPAERLGAGIAQPYRRRLGRVAGVVAASLMFTLLLHGRFWAPGPATSGGPGGGSFLAGSGLTVLAGTGEDAGTQDYAFQALHQRVPEINFYDEPLEAVFDFLRETTGANIWVNWSALANEGIDPDTLVSMQLKDVPVARMLELLFAEFNVGGGDVRFGHGRNVIEISTVGYLRSPIPEIDTVQAVYDVKAVLDAATAVLQATPPTDHGGQDHAEWLIDIQREAAEQLTSVVTRSITPDAWTANGGTDSIEHFAGLLVVRAPEVTQAKVADLLKHMGERLAGGPGRSMNEADQAAKREGSRIPQLPRLRPGSLGRDRLP